MADDITDGYVRLLTKAIELSVRDVRHSNDPNVLSDAWQFLWNVAPNVAERLCDEVNENIITGYS